jgi:hypothetical protein
MTDDKKLKKEQRLMRKENFDTMSRKNFKKANENYEKVDQGFKKNKSDDYKIKMSSFQGAGRAKEVFDEMDASDREAGRVVKAKGGRVNLRGGGCAKRGVKKNAYGKNS